MTAPIAFQKRITELTEAELVRLLDRGLGFDPAIERSAAEIIADVRDRGDDALLDLARRFDLAVPPAIEVPREACREALDELDPEVRAALELAAANIRDFHQAQIPVPFELEVQPGVRLGRRAEPIRRVGVYAPGGRASYPSSVLMGVIPARAAGVEEVVVCSPPGPDGLPPAAVLAACTLAGADRVFAIGGAGAIAALAYGTESVPRVDKIVGPGNAYVTEAKRQLNGLVAIDCPAGPSEVLVIADRTADPELAALELIAQAEHDPLAAAVLVAVGDDVAQWTADALARLVPAQPRREIITASLAHAGAILTAATLEEAIDFANGYAPEHLQLMIEEPRAALGRVRNAGTIFLGAPSSVAFGDYITGANHTLPTAGLARSYSGLSTLDFLRFVTYQEVAPAASARLAAPTATLATAEGLPGHAAAARARGERWGDAVDIVPYPEYQSRPLFVRAAYRDVELYDPGRRPVDVDLSDNTNRFGAPPAAARALAGLDDEALTRYPSVFADGLKELLAELHGVSPENVTTGCGSDDVIDSAFRAFCEPGDVVAYPDPTFGMVALFAKMNAARPRAVPYGPGFELDPDALLAANGRITYVCRPNNPTGTLVERATIEHLARRARGPVLLDEAYADFAGESMADWAIATDRVVVLRTLSKAWGLAGLRIGYAIGPATLIREIEKSRGPYKITAAADAAARAALTEDRGWVAETVARAVENRERLRAELDRLGLRTWPSAANFILVQVPEGLTARVFHAALRERGVAVRAFPDLPGAGETIRVSVGPWPLLERFLAATREVLAHTGTVAGETAGRGS